MQGALFLITSSILHFIVLSISLSLPPFPSTSAHSLFRFSPPICSLGYSRLPYSFSSSLSCLPSFSLYHSEGRRTIHKEEDKGVREKTEEAERESEQCRRRTRARRKERQKPREKVRRKDKTEREREEAMQKAVESALPSASVHSLLLPYLTVSLVINPEELVVEDEREVFSSSLTLGPSSPTARSLSFL